VADNGGGGSSVGVVAIVVIFLIVVLAALFVFRGRIFNRGTNVSVNITTPKIGNSGVYNLPVYPGGQEEWDGLSRRTGRT
jgi:hypothetical protein